MLAGSFYSSFVYSLCMVGTGLPAYSDAGRDGEVPSQKELSSYVEELFSSKVPCQKKLSSPNLIKLKIPATVTFRLQ